MKRSVMLLAFAIMASGWQALASGPFPWWFHTRPKPVLVDQQAQSSTNRDNRTPAVRRIPVANAGGQRPAVLPEAMPPRQSWLTRLFSRPAR